MGHPPCLLLQLLQVGKNNFEHHEPGLGLGQPGGCTQGAGIHASGYIAELEGG